MGKPRVAILGAGPAGLGAAFRLTHRGLAEVTVLERNAWVGGNAGSFELAGIRVDYGSHRLHPACDPEVLGDLRSLLNGDLLDRPRHGRIRMRGRWIHFPLKPVDLALRLPPAFALGVVGDAASKVATKVGRRNGWRPEKETFASVLEAGLGGTICRDFYFPYARKIWGLEPQELSGIQAQRRVSAGSLPKMVRKVLAAVPGFRPPGSGRFFYPRRGYGQICEAYSQAAQRAGAEICLGARVESVELATQTGAAVRYEEDGQPHMLDVDHVWSTIPITILARCLRPAPPDDYLRAAEAIDFRAMILVYLVLEAERFTEFDAHYFPGSDIPISRLSEPKNYSDGQGPSGATVLCAELPCAPDEPEWRQGDEELGELVRDCLGRAGLPVRVPVRQVVTRRLRQAYPIYRRGFEVDFGQLDDWIGQNDGLLSFGRQGLFSHDNLHHALYIGYCAADCLEHDGSFNRERWQVYRRGFEAHVVED
jgi:protoporphyrinogen oxidase